LCSFIFFLFFILILKILFLQIINPDQLIYEGDSRTLRIQSLFNIRGIIRDRLGYPLAVTVPVNAVCVDPSKITEYTNINTNPQWKALSEVLSTPLEKIINKIKSDSKLKFIYLARQVHPEIRNYIMKLKLPGIFSIEESKRYYPSGKIAAQLIGLTNIDGKGIEGIEKSFDLFLTGNPSKRKIRKDNKGKIVENIPLIRGSKANNLTLSINKKLQDIVYQKLNQAVKENQADSGTAILINVKTGEILAMANSPSYNPNNIKHTTKNAIRNRAITDMFEPGSTVKPIVIMQALKLGIIKKDSIINTNSYLINKHIIKDVSYHKKLTITGIIQKSSNVGVSKIALSMSTSELLNSYKAFGLGKPTNLGLIGEKNGLLPHKKVLSNLEKATFSFGYGLMVTPLQLARLYTIIGNYGIDRPLSILKIKKPKHGTRVFPEKYVKNIIHMMESVAESGGGGIKAAIKGYKVAVKTGTVKKIGSNGHYVNKYIAYTAGIVPSHDPKFSLTIVIDNPKMKKYYGGLVAAPVFSKTMKSVLKMTHIKPNYLS